MQIQLPEKFATRFQESLPYRLTYNLKEAEKVDVEKLWKIIDEIGEPISSIFHTMYDDKGNHTGIPNTYVIRGFGMTPGKFSTTIQRIFRHLRSPYMKDRYTVKAPVIGVSIQSFSDEELLNELGRRLKNASSI